MIVHMAGRPTKYKPELADFICNNIVLSSSLPKLCRDNKHLPTFQTIYLWLQTYPEFYERYKRARDIQQDHEADHMVELADAVNETPSALGKARLRIETRRWRAERISPAKWGAQSSIILNGTGTQQGITGSAQELFSLFKAIADSNAPGGNAKLIEQAATPALTPPTPASS